MWSDSEDLAVLSDIYQVRVKIITSKVIDEENPTVNWILPEFAELKDVDIKDMVLFQQNDCHFNLIIDNLPLWTVSQTVLM